MHPLQKHWDRLEALIRQSLESVRAMIPGKDADWVEQFLDHNEFGVAYDWLAGAIEQHSIIVDDVTREQMSEASRLMNQ